MITHSIIVCTDYTYGIGRSDSPKLPWHSKEDLQYFKNTTLNSVCIMGKNTYNSLCSYRIQHENFPLLNKRICIVVSKSLTIENHNYKPSNKDTYCTTTLEKAVRFAEDITKINNYSNIFFIGGRQIFNDSVQYCDQINLNMILENYRCDIFFPQSILDTFNKVQVSRLTNNIINYRYKRI